MNKTRKFKIRKSRVICLLIAVVWIVVIFSFSLHSGVSSHMQSFEVKAFLSGVAHKLGIQNVNLDFLYHFFKKSSLPASELLLRKTAHFSEYFILGVITAISAVILKRTKLKYFFFVYIAGPVVALTDEMIIQKYLSFDRTPSLVDALIDCIGFYLAVLLAAGIIKIILIIRKKRMPASQL